MEEETKEQEELVEKIKDWEKYSKKKCIECGKKVSGNSNRCNKCKGIVKMKYFGEKITTNGSISKDKDYLSKVAWRKNNKEKCKEVSIRWSNNNKEKRKAQSLASKIPLKDYCEKCGSKGEKGKLERHHPNYLKPLEVITLCKCCHMEEHYGRKQ